MSFSKKEINSSLTFATGRMRRAGAPDYKHRELAQLRIGGRRVDRAAG
jgi:hypothetical protein